MSHLKYYYGHEYKWKEMDNTRTSEVKIQLAKNRIERLRRYIENCEKEIKRISDFVDRVLEHKK